MRLAVSSGPLPYAIDAVDDRVAASVAELGFTGVAVHFGYGDDRGLAACSTEQCHRARDVFAAWGIEVVQSWGFGANLIEPDDAARREQLRLLAGALRVAADLGAQMVTCGSGSLNPRGPYWPHRGNFADEVRERLVASLRELAATAEQHGVTIALEPHVATVLDSPEAVRAIVEAVGSPMVRVNLDPVNFVDGLRTLYASTALVERTFDVLGEFVVAGHVKDAYAEDRLVVHMSEAVIGDGDFDVATYVRRYEQLLPDGFLVVEHLPDHLVPLAKSRLDDLLAGLAVPVRTG